MRKFLYIILCCFLLTGCSSKKEDIPKEDVVTVLHVEEQELKTVQNNILEKNPNDVKQSENITTDTIEEMVTDSGTNTDTMLSTDILTVALAEIEDEYTPKITDTISNDTDLSNIYLFGNSFSIIENSFSDILNKTQLQKDINTLKTNKKYIYDGACFGKNGDGTGTLLSIEFMTEDGIIISSDELQKDDYQDYKIKAVRANINHIENKEDIMFHNNISVGMHRDDFFKALNIPDNGYTKYTYGNDKNRIQVKIDFSTDEITEITLFNR